MIAKLALVDGTVFTGEHFGAPGEKPGEVVFNTSMTGYQEILTDPSYRGQIVTMTCPLIGNTGVNPDDVESSRPQVEGFVLRELSPIESNFRSRESLESYCRRHGIIGIQGLDTRALTLLVRERGSMMGILTSENIPNGELVERACRATPLESLDLVRQVTRAEPERWTGRFLEPYAPGASRDDATKVPRARSAPHIVAIDFGIKANILRSLASLGTPLTVVPGTYRAEDVLALRPDGVVLSNGPGDPTICDYAIQTVRDLVGKVPIFGICLGHQFLALALGARTFKLKFGHHGGNQPVKDLATGKVQITCQNHGFAVDPDSLKGTGLDVTHLNLNDGTIEGLRHRELPVFSVQFHPEASPGPHDAWGLFERFLTLVKTPSGVS